MKKNPPRSRRKRPTATLDLKAREIKKDASDKGGEKTAGSSPKSSLSGSDSGPKAAGRGDTTSTNKSNEVNQNKKTDKAAGSKSNGKTTANSSAPRKPPSSPKSGGGFISHLFASVIGAGLGILGLSYANNNNMMPAGFELSGGSDLKQKISTLSGKVGQLERLTSPKAPNGLTARLADLSVRLAQTESSLGYGRKDTPTLADKVTKLEATFNELEQAARSGKGGKLARLTSVSKQLKKSNTQALALKNELIKVREEQNAFREDLSSLRSKQADFVSTAAKISDELARIKNANAQMVANANRPPDVSAQIKPVMSSLKALTAKIDGVMNREAQSKAEGRNIGLALSLGELNRAVHDGVPFEVQLARVVPHAPKELDLSILSKHARAGLVTLKKLKTDFRDISNNALAAEHTPTSGSFVDQLVSSAKNMVQIRPTGDVKGDSTGAIISRMEYKLNRDDLAGLLRESKSLKGKAARVMAPWLDKARARMESNNVLRALEDKIRNALGGAVSSKG